MLYHVTLLYCLTLCAARNSPWKYSAEESKWIQDEFWMVGSNFISSNAVNQLQMFQKDTYDPETINRELGFAKGLGFNAMRVFLHNLLWEDSETFLDTLDDFLGIAESNGIGIMFVLFDSCWNAYPQLGTQPDPIPYRHNSQWVQSPGVDIVNNTDSSAFEALKPYVTGVISHFAEDTRVISWDLWNEPDNSNYPPNHVAPLLSMVFDWAREANPSQPLTTPVWRFMPWNNVKTLTSVEKVQITQSDIISFHSYDGIAGLSIALNSLRGYDKPLVCTEYMARGAGSFFDPNLGYLKDEGVCAFNWGLVSGLTQTIYPWSSNNDPNPYEGIDDPDPWFHDIFNQDGTVKYPDESDYIQSITGVR